MTKSRAFLQINKLKNTLNNHGVIAYPTETVFGLGCNPFDEVALQKLYSIKSRDIKKGVLVLISDKSQVAKYTDFVSNYANELIEKYWPGPITLLFRAKDELNSLLVGEEKKIGLRICNHPIASFLSSNLPYGIVSTSANKSGEAPITSAKEARELFGPKIDFVVEGYSGGKISSSVVDCTGEYPILVRKGVVIPSELSNKVGERI